jgi:hypothetical protein
MTPDLPPELRDAQAEHARLVEQRHQLGVELDALAQQRRQAIEDDTRQLAKTMRAGKRDPGTAAIDRLKTKIEVAVRRRDALTVAITDCQGDRRPRPSEGAGVGRRLRRQGRAGSHRRYCRARRLLGRPARALAPESRPWLAEPPRDADAAADAVVACLAPFTEPATLAFHGHRGGSARRPRAV